MFEFIVICAEELLHFSAYHQCSYTATLAKTLRHAADHLLGLQSFLPTKNTQTNKILRLILSSYFGPLL